jgi:hypothetical protein
MWQFPGNYKYQGKLKVLIKDEFFDASGNLSITFDRRVEAEITVIWNETSNLEQRFSWILARKQVNHIKVVIPGKFILVTILSSVQEALRQPELISLRVIKIISFSSYRTAKFKHDGDRDYKFFSPISPVGEEFSIRMKAYLNDDYSFINHVFERESKSSPENDIYEDPYCALTSGFYLRCGRSTKAKYDNNSFTRSRRNIKEVYAFRFIEIVAPIISDSIQEIKSFPEEESPLLEEPVHFSEKIQETEFLIGILCDFLSILSSRKLFTIYFEYEVFVKGRGIRGFMIPVDETLRVEEVSSFKPDVNLNLFKDTSFFLESCPSHQKIYREITNLKISICENIVNLQLLSACAALEYFYSFWLFEMGGFDALTERRLSQQDKNKLLKLREGGRTPPLSECIRDFLSELSLDRLSYIDWEIGLNFINTRNELLHGKFIDENDLKIFEDREISQAIAIEVLIVILRRSSKSSPGIYVPSARKKPMQDFRVLSSDWNDVEAAMNEIYSQQNEELDFWGD